MNIQTSSSVPVCELDSGQDTHISKIMVAGGFIPFIKECHEKLGDIFMFYLPSKVNPQTPTKVLSVSNPIYLKKTLKIGDRPPEMFEFLKPLLGDDNMQIFEAKRASNFRKLAAPAFGHIALKQNYENILAVAVRMVNKWDEHYGSNEDSSTFSAQDELLKFGFVGAVKMLLGGDISDSEMNEFNHSYDICLAHLFDRQFCPLSIESEQQFEDSLSYIKSFFADVIEHARKNISSVSSASPNLLQIMLSSNDPHTAQPFAEADITSLLSGYLLASYHTTPVCMAWTLLSLAKNPDLQALVHQEIDTVVCGNAPTFDDLGRLPYLTKVIMESLRMFTPGPFAARLLSTCLEIGGYEIPPNTTILYPLCAFHKNSKIWKNPNDFLPERFDESNEDNASAIRKGFYPFGMGARICPGDRFAWMEIKLMLVVFLERFSVALPDHHQQVVPVERFVMMAKDGIHLSLRKR